MIGTTLNQYRITVSIGSGGMGEVFRARDTRLNRDVAIKVLPKDFASDSDRLRRFEQEAKTLAALNHPNVLTIHDAGVHDGAPYLVSELLEGNTLREELNGGALPVRKAMAFALQIAHGLAAAHGKGVIHRDLKPENIFVTRDGRVKILDFGLAKLKQVGRVAPRSPQTSTEAPDGSRGATSPTTCIDADAIVNTTEPGMVLGTPAYMSPEQVSGEPADHRADIFAFGAVLYEMLSGTRAFRRDTPVASMNAVLSEEPPGLTATNAAIPAGLERVVHRCLEKSPEWRFQSASDLAFAIESATATASASVKSMAGSPSPVSRWFLYLLPWGLAAVMSLGFLWSTRRPRVASGDLRTVGVPITLPASEAIPFPDPVPMLAISPDGTRLAYCAQRPVSAVFLRSLAAVGESATRELPGTAGAQGIFFSPDGAWVGFTANGRLKKIASEGASPIDICELPSWPSFGAAWSEDGYIYFGTYKPGILRVTANGGTPEPVTRLDAKAGDYGHLYPELLPGGQSMLITICPLDAKSNDDYWLGVVRPGSMQPPKRLVKGSFARYVPATGHVVFLRQGSLYAARFELARLEFVTEPVPVLAIASFFPVCANANLAISACGDLVYVPSAYPTRSIRWVDAASGAMEQIAAGRQYALPRLSHDGRYLATTVRGIFDNIWIRDLEQGTETQITRGRGDNAGPVWLTNNTGVVYCWGEAGIPNEKLYMKPTFAPDQPPERLLNDKSPDGEIPRSVRPTGDVLVFDRGTAPRRDVWVADLIQRGKAWPLIAEPEFDEFYGEFSPDGGLLAYISNESNRDEVYVRSYESGARVQVSSGGITRPSPKWSRDGTQLYFISGTNIMSAHIKTTPRLQAAPPSVLCAVPTGMIQDRFDVGLDGRLLFIESSGLTSRELVLVLNWAETLKSRVPGKETRP